MNTNETHLRVIDIVLLSHCQNLLDEPRTCTVAAKVEFSRLAIILNILALGTYIKHVTLFLHILCKINLALFIYFCSWTFHLSDKNRVLGT